MFKNCIIHIGTEKTGTTAIQLALAKNAAELSRQGFYYPSELGNAGQRHLTTHAMDNDVFDDGRLTLGVKNSQDVATHRASVEATLKRITEEKSEYHHTLLLSSEHCHSRLSTQASVDRLNRLLSCYCRNFTIYVWLRPQYELAASIYSTRLRVGVIGPDLIPPEDYPLAYYDYAALLDRWSLAFGDRNIVARIYGSSVVADFLSMIKVDTAQMVPAQKVNASLSGEAQRFLELINPHLRENRGHLPSLLERIGLTRSIRPSRSDAETFMSIYAESNEAVRAKWFPTQVSLFRYDLTTLPETADSIELSQTDAFRIFSEIWASR